MAAATSPDLEKESMAQADWYFDVVSPFAYLQLKAHMARVRAALDVRPVPIVLGGILGHWGQKGPAEIAPKRLHTYRIAHWRASELGVPFRFPPAHPFNPIAALRAIVALGGDWPVVETVFEAAWRDGLDLGAPAGLAALAERLETPDLAARVADDAVKLTLRANGEAAMAAGVFGVPTFAVDGELFWGEDATSLLLAFAADRGLLAAPEMVRLATLPVGATRG